MTGNSVYLGFDFGLRRIGVAVGQDVTKSASPLLILQAKNGDPNWGNVDKLISTWSPAALIVGVPTNMDGSDQELTAVVRKFAALLKDKYGLPVHFVDERLTTKSAREQVYQQGGYKSLQKKAIDSIAAKLILEDWLREH